MNIINFQEYYLNSLLKNPKHDYIYDGSDAWLTDHIAITQNGSLVIGLIENINNHNYFLDTHILPEIFKIIKKNIEKEIIIVGVENENRDYILKNINLKFPNKKFINKNINEDIIKDIKMIESEHKIAIMILESSKIFSLKQIIEYI